MAYKSGISHAASALIMTLLSAVIIRFADEYSLMKDFVHGLEVISMLLIKVVYTIFEV